MSDLDAGDEKPLRLDKDMREALLRANEGFTDSTDFSDKNFTEHRNYEIIDGALHVHSRTKTSWADSRNESNFVADDAATHRFLRERISRLETEGVRDEAAAIRAARRAAEKAARQALADQSTDARANADAFDLGLEPEAADSDALLANKQNDRSLNIKLIAAGTLAAVGAAVWAAPRVKQAWQTKGKPRVEAWRARPRPATPEGRDEISGAGGAPTDHSDG